MHTLVKLDSSAKLIDRLHLQHQVLKCLSRMSEDDPNFFVFFSKIFSDHSLPLEFNEVPNLYIQKNTKRSKLKVWVTHLINQTCRDILKNILEEPDIPSIIYWEMGDFFNPEKTYTSDELYSIKDEVVQLLENNELGPNKSLISFKVFVQGKQLYFCIPLPLLNKEIAIEALKRAKPMQSHNHQRTPEKLHSLYQKNIPFRMRQQPA